MLLYRGPSRLPGHAPILVIVAGLDGTARNSKTGPGLAQLYVIPEPTTAHPTPASAARAGHDIAACGGCGLRGLFRPAPTVAEPAAVERVPGTRSCYVNLGQGPHIVAEAWKRGVYADHTRASAATLTSLFSGRGVRLGAYGDPAAIPPRIIRAILAEAAYWTGYTHSPAAAPHLKPFVMASAHSPAHAAKLQARGWRTFRIAPKGDVARMRGEALCPASKEAGKLLTCDRCQACNGTGTGRRGNIMIPLHAGARAAVRFAGVAGL